MLSPDGARELVPQLDVDGIAAAAFDERAGYVTPDLVVQGYARHAARGGALVEQSCAATRILVDGTRVVGVETTHGTIATDRVILTAGVWSSDLFDLPVERERRSMFFTEDAPSFPAELPLTIDFATGSSSAHSDPGGGSAPRSRPARVSHGGGAAQLRGGFRCDRSPWSGPPSGSPLRAASSRARAASRFAQSWNVGQTGNAEDRQYASWWARARGAGCDSA